MRFNGHSVQELKTAIECNHKNTLAGAVPSLLARIDELEKALGSIRAVAAAVKECCRGAAPLPECACARWEAQEEYARRRGVKNVLPHPFPDVAPNERYARQP